MERDVTQHVGHCLGNLDQLGLAFKFPVGLGDQNSPLGVHGKGTIIQEPVSQAVDPRIR